jgi:hypothetical protein
MRRISDFSNGRSFTSKKFQKSRNMQRRRVTRRRRRAAPKNLWSVGGPPSPLIAGRRRWRQSSKSKKHAGRVKKTAGEPYNGARYHSHPERCLKFGGAPSASPGAASKPGNHTRRDAGVSCIVICGRLASAIIARIISSVGSRGNALLWSASEFRRHGLDAFGHRLC